MGCSVFQGELWRSVVGGASSEPRIWTTYFSEGVSTWGYLVKYVGYLEEGLSQPMPCSTAKRTASLREPTPSLPWIAVMWVPTVRGLMKSL